VTNAALTIRHEVAFDPVTQDLIRDLVRAVTRGAAPVAAPEPAKDDALTRLARALEAERSIEALAQRMGPALGAFYRRPEAGPALAPPPADAPSPPPLPKHRLRDVKTTTEQRAALLKRVEVGESQPTQPSEPTQASLPAAAAVKPSPPPPAAKRESQQTYLTVKQAVELAAGKAAPPRPPAAPPRQIRQDLAAEMARFEATKGVIRIPSAQEFAEVGVPMSFPDEAAAVEWLAAHGHQVKKGPGQAVITLDGNRIARPSFPQRAAAIARELGIKLINERKQGRAA
jgi:hypothetical protein